MAGRDERKVNDVYNIPSIDPGITLGQNLRLGHQEKEGSR